MKKIQLNQLGSISGGVSRASRNAGCAAYGMAAGIGAAFSIVATWAAPAIGGLTTLGCMLVTDYD